jgi:acyl-CoA reductase-like NAD-dependent aldehyde dehydrogenase
VKYFSQSASDKVTYIKKKQGDGLRHRIRLDSMKTRTSISQCLSTFRPRYGCYINGRETFDDVKDYFQVYNPATNDVLCEVATGDDIILKRAVENAHDVYQSGVWSRSDVRHRANILTKIAINLKQSIPSLLNLEVSQTGRAVREMKAQLGRLPEWFDYFAALIRTHEGTVPPFLGSYINYVNRVPLGVCGLITPWNHPMLIAIKKIAPAIATGNSIVVKPSELAPVSVLELGGIFTEAGLPNGVVNIVPGHGKQVGQLLCTHPLVRKIDLTGGTPTGRAVGAAAGGNLSSVISELGGKAPMIIFDDSDLEQAVNGAAFATFVASGQTCIMGARLVIHESIYEKFLIAISEKAKRIKLGDPFDMETQMGPVISQESRRRIHSMVSSLIDHLLIIVAVVVVVR